MPAKGDESGVDGPGGSSGFVAFWTSLPGILTGVAALITAVATLAALDLTGGDNGQTSTASAGPESTAAVPAAGSASESAIGSGSGDGCLPRYFDGIASHKLRPVEAGTVDFDVIAANQPKAGTIGLTFTNSNEPVGAMRIGFFPANTLFKIESIVDARCARVEGHANVSRGGDPNVLQNWDTVRFQLDGDSYDLRIGASTTIRLNFEAYAP